MGGGESNGPGAHRTNPDPPRASPASAPPTAPWAAAVPGCSASVNAPNRWLATRGQPPLRATIM